MEIIKWVLLHNGPDIHSSLFIWHINTNIIEARSPLGEKLKEMSVNFEDIMETAENMLRTVTHNVHLTSLIHYNDVIMGTMASQIPSLTIVYSTVIQAQIKENIKAPRHWPLCREFTGEFPAQMASNVENVSIGWRHHVDIMYHTWLSGVFHAIMINHVTQHLCNKTPKYNPKGWWSAAVLMQVSGIKTQRTHNAIMTQR